MCQSIAKNFVSLLLFFLMLSMASGPANAQSNSTYQQQQFISDLYQSYYQRNAGVSEISEWLGWFQRGSTAEEIHASFISSDEFFNRLNRNPDQWITNVFRIVENRNPTVPEFNYWKQRWVALGTDRRKFGLEFLKSQGNRRPGFEAENTTNQLSTLANQLAAQARSLSTSINQEVPGNTTVLRMQANSLIAATAQFYSLSLRNNTNQRDLAQAFKDVQAAHAGVRTGLYGSSGAFNSKIYLDQIERSMQQIGQRINVSNRPTIPTNESWYPGQGSQLPGFGGGQYFPNQPSRPGNGFPGGGFPGGGFHGGNRQLSTVEYNQVNQLAYELSQETRSVYFLLRNLSQSNFRYQSLAGDLQWFSSQVDDFRSQLNPQTRRRNLRQSIRTMSQYVDGYSQRIRNAQVDIRLQQGIFQMNQSLERMGNAISGNFQGGFGQSPSIPNRQQWLDEIDRALAQCDRLIAVYSQYLLYGRNVQVYLAQLKNLKRSLLSLRASIVRGIDRYQLRTETNAIVSSIAVMEQTWGKITQSVRLIDNSDMNALKTSATRLNSLSQ